MSTQSISDELYAQTVGDEFIRIRGAGLVLSPLDLDLITKWHELGVPLHIPLTAMAEVEGYRRQKPELRVRGLSYIREEVESSFAELLEGHVGCGGCEKPYCGARA